MIIPSNDSHFGEYIPDHYKCREWLSHFTGSAGTLVVTGDKAALWTDSRDFQQAEKEMEDGSISCTALALLYYCVRVERKEKYLKKQKFLNLQVS